MIVFEVIVNGQSKYSAQVGEADWMVATIESGTQVDGAVTFGPTVDVRAIRSLREWAFWPRLELQVGDRVEIKISTNGQSVEPTRIEPIDTVSGSESQAT